MITIEACHNGQRCPYLDNIDVFSLKKDYEYFKGRALELELRLAQIEKENQELRRGKASLEYELKQLRAKIFKPRARPKPPESQAKRGAPVGHQGGGRKRPEEISEEIKIYPQCCDKCSGEIKIYENKYDEHIVEDIVIKKKTTRYRLHYGYCQRCQRVIYPKDKERASIIPYDRIGSTARAVGGYLHYIGIPYRKVENIFRDVFGLEITHPSFLAFNTEQAKNGFKVYETLKKRFAILLMCRVMRLVGGLEVRIGGYGSLPIKIRHCIRLISVVVVRWLNKFWAKGIKGFWVVIFIQHTIN